MTTKRTVCNEIIHNRKRVTFLFDMLPFGVAEQYTAVQRQNAVSAYFTSKQILPFVFAEQYTVYDPAKHVGK